MNGLISKPGGTVHVWIGWIAMAVLVISLPWGFIGPREARFTAFYRGVALFHASQHLLARFVAIAAAFILIKSVWKN